MARGRTWLLASSSSCLGSCFERKVFWCWDGTWRSIYSRGAFCAEFVGSRQINLLSWKEGLQKLKWRRRLPGWTYPLGLACKVTLWHRALPEPYRSQFPFFWSLADLEAAKTQNHIVVINLYYWLEYSPVLCPYGLVQRDCASNRLLEPTRRKQPSFSHSHFLAFPCLSSYSCWWSYISHYWSNTQELDSPWWRPYLQFWSAFVSRTNTSLRCWDSEPDTCWLETPIRHRSWGRCPGGAWTPWHKSVSPESLSLSRFSLACRQQVLRSFQRSYFRILNTICCHIGFEEWPRSWSTLKGSS